MNKKIIMTGLANSKTSLGEVFRRYIECFQTFSNPDIFDLTKFTNNDELYYEYFPQFNGIIDHDIKYFHTTFDLYKAIKNTTKPIPKNPDIKKIGYFVWESSEIHDSNVSILEDFDEIWTASNYCKNVFSQYISDKKIQVVAHPIPFYEKEYKKYKNFTILMISNISSNADRKNIQDNIEVAKTVKSKFKNINIILKTITSSDSERLLLKNIVGNSDVKVIDEYYTSKQMTNLLSKCHVLLSLHKSEGFGLTLAEAMAVNTIPLATGYSGNTDFMKNSNFLVDYKLKDVSVPYFKGKWAQPDKDDAISKLENIINNNLKPESLDSSFSYQRVTEKIKNILCPM